MRWLIVLAACVIAAPAFGAAPKHAAKPQKPIDALFQELAQAGSTEEAKPIEDQIDALFMQSDSPTVDILMKRGNAAAQGGGGKIAARLYVAVTQVAPNYAEGWHSRAQIEAQSGDDESAMISLEHAVLLNPREFNALAELGELLEDYGKKKAALDAWRQVVRVDPNFEDAGRHVRALTVEVEGQDI